ncbi:MAG: amidohydrolase [Spirochaetes bacterium]|nr:amidohydrolase [Spirochaetota bacterium]
MIARIFYGVPVYTMDEKRSVHESVVSVNGKIDFVGPLKSALERYPGADRVPFDKGCILPGFIDAHIHLREFSMLFRDLDLSAVLDETSAVDLIGEKVSNCDKGEWVVAGGLPQTFIELLTAKDLDAVSPDNPVIVYSMDIGTALVNLRVLETAEIDEGRNDPFRGKIETDEHGHPNGILRDRAIDLVRKKIPDQGERDTRPVLETGIEKLIRCGVTSFCDCSQDPLGFSLKGLLDLHRKQKLGVKAVLLFNEHEAADLGRSGIPSGFGSSRLRIGGLKLIMDGSLTTLTGYMSDPYRSSGSNGILLIEEEELLAILRRAYTHGIWASVQTTGDRAGAIALDSFQKVMHEIDMPDMMKRIEHARALRDEDIERFADLGVAVVGNPVRIPLDRQRAIEHLGPNARLLYRYAGLVRAGAVFGIGSDAPMGSIDPLHGIYCAVERKDYGDGPEVRFYPKERLSVAESVAAYTVNNAAVCGLSEETGSLETGKCADMVHLSHDIFVQDSEKLRDTLVLHTVIEGDVAWEMRARETS